MWLFKRIANGTTTYKDSISIKFILAVIFSLGLVIGYFVR